MLVDGRNLDQIAWIGGSIYQILCSMRSICLEKSPICSTQAKFTQVVVCARVCVRACARMMSTSNPRVFLAAEHVNGLLLARPVKTTIKGACLLFGVLVANVVLTDRWFTMCATALLMIMALVL